MLELGKPIHVFDAACGQRRHRSSFAPRRAGRSSRRSTMSSATLDPDTLVIADARGPIGIAGVMGGATQRGERRRRRRRSSSRPCSTPYRSGEPRSATACAARRACVSRRARSRAWRALGADRTAQLLAEWAGGRRRDGRGRHEPCRRGAAPRHLPTGCASSRLLGTEIDRRRDGTRRWRASRSTTESGEGGATLVAVVPPHRRDIEIEEDVAEEVIRVIGYETLPPRLPSTVMPGYRAGPAAFRRHGSRPARRPWPERSRDQRTDRARSTTQRLGYAAGRSGHDPRGKPGHDGPLRDAPLDAARSARRARPQRAPAPRGRRRSSRSAILHEWRDDGPQEASSWPCCWLATGATNRGPNRPARRASTTSRASSKCCSAGCMSARSSIDAIERTAGRRASGSDGQRVCRRGTMKKCDRPRLRG